MIGQIKKALLQFEELSKNVRVFNTGVHAFLYKLHDREAIKSYFVSYSDGDEILISIEFNDGKMFEELFKYDKEIYNVSTNKS